LTVLNVDKLSLAFGGLTVLDGVSFDIAAPEILSVIGPNGAGKTSLFNTISGLYRATAGSVSVQGRETTALPAHELAGLGVGRTFQSPQTFGGASVLDTVMIGRHFLARQGLAGALLRLPAFLRSERAAEARCRELLAFVELEDVAHWQADRLSYGALKRLDLARALAAEPRLLLLDEPAAGLNSSETRDLKTLISKIFDTGVAVVLVEHDMRLVMEISHRVLVLNQGRVLALGPPGEVAGDARVREAYLGAGSNES
jgi:branched-chain amino acid transport system ATP-binding protein